MNGTLIPAISLNSCLPKQIDNNKQLIKCLTTLPQGGVDRTNHEFIEMYK